MKGMKKDRASSFLEVVVKKKRLQIYFRVSRETNFSIFLHTATTYRKTIVRK